MSLSIRLGAREYPLRPTFQAVENIERHANATVVQLYQALRVGGLQLHETALIVIEGARAADVDFQPDATTKALFEMGYQNEGLRRLLAQFLLECAHGPEQAGKKFEAEWPRSTPTPAPASAPADIPIA